MKYQVEFYGRKAGSIGEFSRMIETVETPTVVPCPPKHRLPRIWNWQYTVTETERAEYIMEIPAVYDHPAVKSLYRHYEHIQVVRLIECP